LETRDTDKQQHGGPQVTLLTGSQNKDFTHLVNMPGTQSAVRHQLLKQDVTQTGEKHSGQVSQGQSFEDDKAKDRMNQTQNEKQEEISQWDTEKHEKVSN
jgi:hypothetical protein